ncbi:MAG: 50S ribosomal protein L30 [Nanoarchaeota archaeon]|mgnify:CR=1 FL=1
MIAIIRISGRVNLKTKIEETLDRLRLRRKYSCVVIKSTKETQGMLNLVRDFVAYGEISEEIFEKLIQQRGQLINKNKKIDSKKVIEDLGKDKKYEELNLKPFFRLHPPRKGIKSKKHFNVGGVLGNNREKINELIERML